MIQYFNLIWIVSSIVGGFFLLCFFVIIDMLGAYIFRNQTAIKENVSLACFIGGVAAVILTTIFCFAPYNNFYQFVGVVK